MWGAKLSDIKTDLTILCIILSPFVSKYIASPQTEDIHSLSVRLADSIFQEYTEKPERDQLHLSDLDLRFRSASAALQGPTFALRESNGQAEINWSILALLPLFSGSLGPKSLSYTNDSDHEIALSSAKKRFKKTSWLDEILQKIKNSDRSSRIGSLQVLAFHTQLVSVDLQDLQQILDLSSQLATSGDGVVASWAFLILANCALQPLAEKSTIKDQWSLVWQLASRNVNNPSTSRAVCHCLHALLISELVLTERIQELAQSFQASMDVNGPATCDESTCEFMRVLIRSTDGARILKGTEIREQIVAWCLGKWTPGKSHF